MSPLITMKTMTKGPDSKSTISTQSPPVDLVNGLRTALAGAISDFKAYEVPGVCSRIGLASGSEEEAFASKQKYASKRLAHLPWTKVLDAARDLDSSVANFKLSEAISKVEEAGIDTISEITRRRIISLFDKRLLCTEIEEIDFLARLWPIDKMPSVYDGPSRTFEDDIRQHTIANMIGRSSSFWNSPEH